MNARRVGRRDRWAENAFMVVGLWLLASACAEPAPVDPSLVPEASIDVAPESGDADRDVLDALTGSGGSGGSGGSDGSSGSGGFGGATDSGGDETDVRSEGGDASADASADAPPPDVSVPRDGPADASGDPVSDPSQDGDGRSDTGADIAADRG